MRDCPSRHDLGGGNGRFQSKTSSAPTGLPSQQYKSSSIGGGQRQNRLYALQARHDEKGSLDVFIGTLLVFDPYNCALLDPGATVYFVTPYITFQFSVSPEPLSEPFSVTTLVCDPVIARRV